MAIAKRQKITSVWKNMEKSKSLYIVGKDVNYYKHYEKQYGGSPQNYK